MANGGRTRPRRKSSTRISQREAVEELLEEEQFWIRCEPWLREKGYALRPRYRAGWEPSWKTSGKSPLFCEDGQVLNNIESFLDGERLSDRKAIHFKKLDLSKPTEANELEINRLLSQEPYVSDPCNHCSPCYELLHVPTEIHEGDVVLLVTPLFTRWHDPPFGTIGEAVEFFRQTFEGLAWLHRHRIAHNDVKFNNIMMDSTPLYAIPCHPANNKMSLDWSQKVEPASRTEHPVKYYYIDFGLSKQYKEDDELAIDPGYGGDTTVPEFKRKEKCNPFCVDVYRMGHMIAECLTQGGLSTELFPRLGGLEFMDELVGDMMKSGPKDRPTMDEVVARFATIRDGLGWRKLRAPLHPLSELESSRGFRHWRKQLSLMAKGNSAIPTPKA